MVGGTDRARSQAQEVGLAKKNSVVAMLLDGCVFRAITFLTRRNTFEVEEMGVETEEFSSSAERCTEVLRKIRKTAKDCGYKAISRLPQSSIVDRIRAAVVVVRAQ